jgi:hypothetical protein
MRLMRTELLTRRNLGFGVLILATGAGLFLAGRFSARPESARELDYRSTTVDACSLLSAEAFADLMFRDTPPKDAVSRVPTYVAKGVESCRYAVRPYSVVEKTDPGESALAVSGFPSLTVDVTRVERGDWIRYRDYWLGGPGYDDPVDYVQRADRYDLVTDIYKDGLLVKLHFTNMTGFTQIVVQDAVLPGILEAAASDT